MEVEGDSFRFVVGPLYLCIGFVLPPFYARLIYIFITRKKYRSLECYHIMALSGILQLFAGPGAICSGLLHLVGYDPFNIFRFFIILFSASIAAELCLNFVLVLNRLKVMFDIRTPPFVNKLLMTVDCLYGILYVACLLSPYCGYINNFRLNQQLTTKMDQFFKPTNNSQQQSNKSNWQFKSSDFRNVQGQFGLSTSGMQMQQMQQQFNMQQQNAQRMTQSIMPTFSQAGTSSFWLSGRERSWLQTGGMFGAKKPTQLDTYTGTIKYYYVNGIRMDDLDLMQYKTRCEVAALRRLDDALEEQRRQREEAQKAKREAEQLQQQPQQKDSTPEEAAKRGWSLLNAFKISLQTIVGGGRASATRTAKKRAAGVGATATRVAAAAEVSAQSATAQVTRTLTPCTQDELGTAGDAYGFVQNGRGLISMAPQTWLNGEALCRILCDEIRQLNTALQPEERTAVADPQFWEYRFTEHYRNYEEYEAALRQNVTYGISLHMHGDTVAFGRVILPIHLTDHWALGILNVSTNQVIVYNSLEARDTITHPNDSQFEQITKLQQWAAHIVQDVLHRAAPQEPCSVQFAPRTLQLYQKDGYNCGIHVIDNALHYLRAVPRPEQGVGQMRVVDIREPGVIDIKTYANRLRNEYRARLMRMYPHVVTSALRNFADDIAQARRDMQKALDHRKAVADRSVIPVDAQGKRVQPKAPQVSYEQAKANEKRLQEALAEFNAFHATIHAQQQDTAPQQSTSVLGKVIKVEPASQKKAAHENPEIADLLAQMRQMESEENSEDDEEADTASMDAVQQGMDFLRSQMKGYTQQFDGTAEYSSEKARQDRHRAKNRETLNANKRELMSLKRLSQTEEERAADNAKRRSTKKALTDEQRAKRTEQQHLRRTIKKEEEEEQKKKEKMTVLSPVPPQPSKRVLKMDPKNVKRRQKNAEKRQAAKRKPEDTATDDAQNLVAFTAAVTKDPVDFVVALEQIQTTQDLTKHAASLATSIRSLALNSPASTSGPRRKRRKTIGLTKIHYKTCQLDHPGRGCAAQSATHRVPPWSPGTFNIPCQHCGARMNPPEKRRGWTGCCHGGKVDAEHMKRMFYLLQNPPQLMKELTDPDHVNARDYLANDRKINAHFAMGSITTNRDTTLPRGPNVVKLNNEMQPRLSDLCRSSKHEQPTFGQYYALKAEEAINYRLKTDLGKGPLGAGGARSSVIAAIDLIIRRKHALASSYSFAAEKFEEACRQAELNNEPVRMSAATVTTQEAKLAGVQDPNIHTHRTEIPATEQVAVIWISNDDNARPPDFQGIDLHNTPDGTVNMGTRGSVPLVLPTCFPILDPFGLQGYRFGLPNKIKEDADRAAAEAASAMEVDGEIFYDARDVGTQKSQSSQKKADAKHPDGEADDDEQPFEEANKKDADAHGVITYDGVNHDMQFNLVDDPEDQQKKKGDLYADPILFSHGQVADADEKEDEFLLLDEEMIDELAKDGPPSVLYYSNGHQEERKGRNDVARNIIYHELVQEELTDEEKKALEERRRAAEHELEILATQAATPAEPPPVLTIYDLFQPTDLPTVDVGLASFTVFNRADALDCFNGKEHISELAILRYLAYRVQLINLRDGARPVTVVHPSMYYPDYEKCMDTYVVSKDLFTYRNREQRRFTEMEMQAAVGVLYIFIGVVFPPMYIRFVWIFVSHKKYRDFECYQIMAQIGILQLFACPGSIACGIMQLYGSDRYGILFFTVVMYSASIAAEILLNFVLALNRLKVIYGIRIPRLVNKVLMTADVIYAVIYVVCCMSPYCGYLMRPGQYVGKYDFSKPYTYVMTEINAALIFPSSLFTFIAYILIIVKLLFFQPQIEAQAKREKELFVFAVIRFACDMGLTTAFILVPPSPWNDLFTGLGYFFNSLLVSPVLYLTLTKILRHDFLQILQFRKLGVVSSSIRSGVNPASASGLVRA
ncbi:hypothetical protein QR680_010046 [Steinernema hermaphroditum]|uniref:Ubiquitin-like protease family profile domain-containing protein n=1 Tax=Steinernema hermaphroditum TaxID=289476 RepID=A0AA39INS5_9BILA|nr:hypothetical protein QR680_010046 [Steinernema hermaphroditum]